MITVERLNRTYGSLRAVQDVSFTISQGEVIGLLGPNGAGKTTIMKMMCGYLEPSSGRVTINGIDVAEDTKLAQSYIGYLPENLPVYPEMTIVSYLEYAASLRGIPQEQQAAEIRRVLNATDLRGRALDKIGSLSRGLKQRVGVAQALLGNPKVLVLDEPTNGLDPTQTLQMRELIRKLAETSTVIVSTHILSEVEAVCDRVLMVRSGKLVLDSRLDALTDASELKVKTSLTPDALQPLLQVIEGIKGYQFQQHAGITECRIKLAEPSAGNDISASLAKKIIENGGALYQLHREQRDLETLFRELNSGEGIANAA
ncbi:ABC transporter ATP-binding protein [Saccharophagus sp. K07]|uniref:ABC transporter ATP-binding protein n=1 Tax=Saccharophagus sp. K07 TaxID=2283636 RepID=UPI0016522240|nr:ABC transporter ATP-binding protein [Saccharophagus sp. K07]